MHVQIPCGPWEPVGFPGCFWGGQLQECLWGSLGGSKDEGSPPEGSRGTPETENQCSGVFVVSAYVLEILQIVVFSDLYESTWFF